MLLSVPRYNFNWQFHYQLKDPVFLPAGSRIVARGAMDNSDRNPFNPNPNRPVTFGLQTKHEMFFGFTTLRYEGDTPASRDAQMFYLSNNLSLTAIGIHFRSVVPMDASSEWILFQIIGPNQLHLENCTIQVTNPSRRQAAVLRFADPSTVNPEASISSESRTLAVMTSKPSVSTSSSIVS